MSTPCSTSPQLYLYHVSFANGHEIIIAAVDFKAAHDCARDELLKRTDTVDVDRISKIPYISITQIYTNTHFAVAPT